MTLKNLFIFKVLASVLGVILLTKPSFAQSTEKEKEKFPFQPKLLLFTPLSAKAPPKVVANPEAVEKVSKAQVLLEKVQAEAAEAVKEDEKDFKVK